MKLNIITDKSRYLYALTASMALQFLALVLPLQTYISRSKTTYFSVLSRNGSFFGLLLILSIAFVGLFLIKTDNPSKNKILGISAIIVGVSRLILLFRGNSLVSLGWIIFSIILVISIGKDRKLISIGALIFAGFSSLSFLLSLQNIGLSTILGLLSYLGNAAFALVIYDTANSDELWFSCVSVNDGGLVGGGAGEAENYGGASDNFGTKMNIGTLVLLCLFTFGVYPIIWYYKTMKYLRRFSDENPNDVTVELLLCIFIPFYIIYWHYKYSKILYNEMTASGMRTEDFSSTHLIFAIFIGIVAIILEQSRINELIDIKNGVMSNYQQQNQSAETGFSEKLRELSKLKDDGILTQDEFEEKKKELLNKI
jgi:hypothetical protein